MHMMAYDQGGEHSTWEFAEEKARQGAKLLPPAKVTLGLPFYGRDIRTGDWKSYEDLVQAHLPGPHQDRVGTHEHTQYFNSPALISQKTRMASRLGLGGVMIWEVGQDCRRRAKVSGDTTHVVTCPRGDDDSLLLAVARALPGAERSERDEL